MGSDIWASWRRDADYVFELPTFDTHHTAQTGVLRQMSMAKPRTGSGHMFVMTE